MEQSIGNGYSNIGGNKLNFFKSKLNVMKSMIKVSLFSALFMLVALSSYGQRGRGGDFPSPEERAKQQTAQMAENLKLTDEQEKEVGNINLAYAKKMMEAREEAAGDRDAMRTKMGVMMKEKNGAIKEVLTEEQLKTLEEMRSQYQDRRKEGQRRDWKGRKGGRKDRSNPSPTNK